MDTSCPPLQDNPSPISIHLQTMCPKVLPLFWWQWWHENCMWAQKFCKRLLFAIWRFTRWLRAKYDETKVANWWSRL